MKKETQISFKHFLEKFPKIKLPVTLSDDSHHDFSKHNPPLPVQMIEQFLIPLEQGEVDEFTEYIPCFRLPKTEKFHAIVYWKAALLNYEYILLTFDKKGVVLDKQIIAGTKTKDNALIRSVATIDEDWIIYMAGGVAPTNDETNYDAASTHTINLELLADGKIIPSN